MPSLVAPVAAPELTAVASTASPSRGDKERWVAEATRVCREAARGNLEERVLHAETAPDEMRDLAASINQLLDMTDAFVREAVAALEHAGQQKFYRRVLREGMLGSFHGAVHSINRATDGMEAKSRELEQAEADRDAVAEDFQAALAVVEELNRASQEIGDASELIKKIAQQSNMLALNAAIESARAGDAGKGFGVVASEVRQLAEQTSDSTKDIGRRVTAMQNASRHMSAAIERIWNAVRAES